MKRLCWLLLVAGLWSCGGSKSTTPTTPSPSTVSLTGVIYDLLIGPNAGMANARVEITSGPGTGRSATTDGGGRYRFDNLARGTVVLRVSLDGFVPATPTVTLTGDSESNVGLLATSVSVSGTTVNLLSGSPVSGVNISGGSLPVTSDSGGAFSVSAPPNALFPTMFTFTAPSLIERQTGLRLPGRDATVSMIPSSFDLASFDQMFRDTFLRRWRTAPPLVLEQRIGQFAERSADTITLLEDAMSDAESDSMINDLKWALPQLTGNEFGDFTSVNRQTSAGGGTFTLKTTGRITVMRVRGMRAALGTTVGLGQWQYFSDGTVVAGVIMMDLDFDRSTSPFIRTIRAHELGHALGINHCELRTSVMNPTIGVTAFTPFDLDAGRVAYQRPPGNRSPDIDPQGASQNVLGGVAIWSPRIR